MPKRVAARKSEPKAKTESEAKIAVLNLRAEALRLDIARKRGRLVDSAFHDRELTRVAAAIRAAVMALPATLRASAESAGGTLSPAEIERIARQQCGEAT